PARAGCAPEKSHRTNGARQGSRLVSPNCGLGARPVRMSARKLITGGMERDYQEMRDTQVGRTPAAHKKPGKMTHQALTQDTRRMSDQSLSRAIGSLRRLVPPPARSQ